MLALLKRVLNIGEVVHVVEIRGERAWRSAMRLRLKRDQRTGKPYAVLKVGAFGTAIYRELSPDEIHAWADAFRSIEAAMKTQFGPWNG